MRQLSEQDKNKYRQFYCGLCHTLGTKAGFKGQMLLNYDLCFLAILLQSLYEPEISQGKHRCIIHPVKLKNFYTSEAIDYAADMDIIPGIEGYFGDNGSHLILIAKDYQGYLDLCKIITEASEYKKADGNYPNHPTITFENLEKNMHKGRVI